MNRLQAVLALFPFFFIVHASAFAWDYAKFNFGIDQNIEMHAVFSSTVLSFQHTLMAAELAVEEGKKIEFERNMEFAREILAAHDKYSDIIGEGAFVRMRLMMEYAIARMINNRSSTSIVVKPSHINVWLPDPISGERMLRNKRICRQNSFRRLLIIGAAIESYYRVKGILPSELTELCGIGDVRDIIYVHDGEFWKVRLGDGVQEPMYDFFPAVDDFTGTCYNEMWFASTYSLQRKKLYLEGKLESSDPRCRCYLSGSVVHRGVKPE